MLVLRLLVINTRLDFSNPLISRFRPIHCQLYQWNCRLRLATFVEWPFTLSFRCSFLSKIRRCGLFKPPKLLLGLWLMIHRLLLYLRCFLIQLIWNYHLCLIFCKLHTGIRLGKISWFVELSGRLVFDSSGTVFCESIYQRFSWLSWTFSIYNYF